MPRKTGYVPRNASELPLSALDAAIAQKEAEVAGGAPVPAPRIPLYQFVWNAWPLIDQNKFLPNWHLRAKCELLEAVTDGQLDKVILNEPPGLAKSKTSSVCWPAWEWGPAHKPQTRWLCVSYGGGDEAPAVRDAGVARNLIYSPWYQAGWGTEFQFDPAQNAKTFYRNTKMGYRVSVGLDGGIPGQRADRILIDDPSKPDDVFSQAALRRPVDIWEHALRHRIVDEGSAVVLVMHRLHDDDLTGYFLKSDGWVHLRLPQFYEAKNKSQVFLSDGRLLVEDERTVEGQPLHPGMRKAVSDAAQQMRDRPDIASGQQQQHPTQLEGTTIKVAWMHRWDPAEITRSGFIWDDVIITMDCAFKDGKQNSYVVMQCWAIRHAIAYLIGQHRAHLDLPGTLETFQVFVQKFPQARAKYVEAKANGIGVVQSLKNVIPGLMTTDEDEDILKPFCMGSKEAKLASVAPFFKAGNIRIPPDTAMDLNGDPWVKDYIYELTTFPKAMGGHDDQVDATAMAVWRLLYMFNAQVSAAMIMAPDAGNVGLVAGVFDTAYAHAETVGTDLGRAAFGGGAGGIGGMWRNAYGR